MLTFFITSLALLTVFFAGKFVEMKVGRRLILADIRERADEFLLRTFRDTAASAQRLKREAVQAYRLRIRQVRRRLSDLFAYLADTLR